ncbi:hypothetical protein UY3_10072 [Chelonia mydas]|uniref:Myb/SANT-like DNA-binding domain-containing protein n=1 Tax=Chelonia mydas TaxID=8469 RepID=M7BB67_CHEMY|nr:hypothetical protein UY3_10072 [Chelonia mydas]
MTPFLWRHSVYVVTGFPRKLTTYGQISQYTTKRGHDRDTLQCRVKVKELRNTYHKVQEAKRRFGAAPTSCRFYKELDAILGSDPTSTAKITVDTLMARVPVESALSQEKEALDENVEREGDPEAKENSEVRDACSQELISTPEESSQSQLLELGEAQTGGEAPETTEPEPPKKKINFLLVTSDSDDENEHVAVCTALDGYRAEPIISTDTSSGTVVEA